MPREERETSEVVRKLGGVLAFEGLEFWGGGKERGGV